MNVQLSLSLEGYSLRPFKRALVALLLVLLWSSVQAVAAVHYVRPGATGSGTGSDWSNAYATLPSSLIRGDTYYLADGTYGSRIFSGSGTGVITLKKATESDHGTDTGWNSNYGDGQAEFKYMEFNSGHYLIDGSKRNSNWRSGALGEYGIRVSSGGGTAIRINDNVTNVTFRFVDAMAGGRDTGRGDDVVYAVWGGISGITFQQCALHDSDRTIFLLRNVDGLTVEHCYIARNASSAAIHGEIMSITSGSNHVWRHNIIEDPEGTAVWAFLNNGTASNWQIYGNVIRHTSAYTREGISGVIFAANDASNKNFMNGLRYYNNTHWGIKGLWSGVVIQAGTGNIVENNIWSQSVNANNNGAAVAYNTFYATPGSGGSDQTVSTQPLVSPSSGNFMLASATTAGRTLPAPFNVDPDGVPRGADGVWDRGAFEYGGAEKTPAPPTDVKAQ